MIKLEFIKPEDINIIRMKATTKIKKEFWAHRYYVQSFKRESFGSEYYDPKTKRLITVSQKDSLIDADAERRAARILDFIANKLP